MPVNRLLVNLVTSVQMSRVTLVPGVLDVVADPAAVVVVRVAALAVLIDGAPADVVAPIERPAADRWSDP